MDWSLEVVVLPVSDIDRSIAFSATWPASSSWGVQEIKARADIPLLPKDHAGLGEWAGR
jgi:hypothetical protein